MKLLLGCAAAIAAAAAAAAAASAPMLLLHRRGSTSASCPGPATSAAAIRHAFVDKGVWTPLGGAPGQELL